MIETETLYFMRCDGCGVYLKKPYANNCSFENFSEMKKAMRKEKWTQVYSKEDKRNHYLCNECSKGGNQ